MGLFMCGFSCSFRSGVVLSVGLALVLEVALFTCGYSCSFSGWVI